MNSPSHVFPEIQLTVSKQAYGISLQTEYRLVFCELPRAIVAIKYRLWIQPAL